MNIEEAKLYLEHTSKDDFNLEEWQKENRYQAIQVLLKENQKLKEQLENKIDLYEDTISYQLGFDKGQEQLQQRIDIAIEYINKYESIKAYYEYEECGYEEYNYDNDFKDDLLEILEGKE